MPSGFFEPYRPICRIIGQQAFIAPLADGRRDVQALLARHLPDASPELRNAFTDASAQ
jgi:hypothetical protein